MKKFLIVFIGTIGTFIYANNNIGFSKENIILKNIEVLVGEEEGVDIQSCYMDKDIVSDAGSAASYTICNSQTTSSMVYKCGSDKRGSIKYSPYPTPTYTCKK